MADQDRKSECQQGSSALSKHGTKVPAPRECGHTAVAACPHGAWYRFSGKYGARREQVCKVHGGQTVVMELSLILPPHVREYLKVHGTQPVV